MTDSNPPAEQDEDRYHVVASASLTPGGTHVLKHGDLFVLVDRFGDIQPANLGEQGLYYGGTRFVSRLRLRLDRNRPLLLSSSVAEDNLLLQVDMTNPDLVDRPQRALVPYGTLHLARSRFLQQSTCFERILLSNYGAQATEVELSLDFAGDFVDIFEVRGTRRPERGVPQPAELDQAGVSLLYHGLDGLTRRTRFEFTPRPDRLEAGLAVFHVRLESKQTRELGVWIECQVSPRQVTLPRQQLVSFEAGLSQSLHRLRAEEAGSCEIYTSNEQFNDWLNRSRSDLRMLVTDTAHGPYPYAGVPWFSTPFGRDGLWTALQTLWIQPELAAGVLRFLSSYQATELDPDLDAQPGKILHEMRDGEMAALRKIPFGRYYGSIDSTPLYLMLAERYYERTGDRALIESIWPNLLAAVEWLDKYGDSDGDGFVEYGRMSKDGLVQQGWKDSNDSVFHRDGTFASGPIALAEVQGYAYAALSGMARLAQVMAEGGRQERWQSAAQKLRTRFDESFWCAELSTYALALDDKKLPCRVRTSNAGQCLYTGIAAPDRVAALAEQLMSPEMFSGWGIRTLATGEQRYNPMSYHNGSIWPHDNAIVATGLAQSGHKALAARVLGALFDATLFMRSHRLPELFCGFAREAGQGPTLYPVACSPQAWSSGAVFMLLQAVVGLEVDAVARRVVFRHAFLPPFLEEVRIRGLRVGEARVDLRLLRHTDDVGVTVTRKTGDVEVVGVQ
jgi:glycogen debranching enzyme